MTDFVLIAPQKLENGSAHIADNSETHKVHFVKAAEQNDICQANSENGCFCIRLQKCPFIVHISLYRLHFALNTISFTYM